MAKAPARKGDPLTLKHYSIFGRITVEYANLEVGLRLTLAGYMGQGITRALIMTAPYTSQHLRNVTKALTKHLMPAEHGLRTHVLEAVGAHKSAAVLRNDIAHNLWRKGDRPQSIAPMYVDIRNEKAEFKGMEDKNRDYTTRELEGTLTSLINANRSLANLQTTPRFEAFMSRNIKDRSDSSEASEGNS